MIRFGAGNRTGVSLDVLFLVHPGSADQIPVIFTVCSTEVFKSQERAAQEPYRELAARHRSGCMVALGVLWFELFTQPLQKY